MLHRKKLFVQDSISYFKRQIPYDNPSLFVDVGFRLATFRNWCLFHSRFHFSRGKIKMEFVKHGNDE